MNCMIFFLLASSALLDLSHAVNTKTCGGDTNAHLTITDCPEDGGTAMNPCILKEGNTYKFQLTFTPEHDESSPTVTASGTALGITKEIPLSTVDSEYHTKPCDYSSDKSGLKCPLKANEQNTYTVELPITSEMKKISVNARFEISGSDGKPIVCLTTQLRAA